jgi:hypothetical protein
LETLADNHKREAAIEKWMLTIVDDGGVRRLDDLHLDKIDSAWKDRSRWVESGLEAFRLGRILRDRLGLPFTVALSFSLTSDSRPCAIDFQTRKELEEKLNWSPPSLYLFRRGEEPRHKMAPGGSVQDLNPSMFSIQGADALCCYMEFLQQDAEEYWRSVFIEG